MIIIRLFGGLGNQLFIYAFGRALEISYGCEVRFDNYSGFKKDPYRRKFELDNFNVKIKKSTLFDSLYFPIIKRSSLLAAILFPGAILVEQDTNFSIAQLIEFSKKNKIIYLQGYFQKLEYFNNIKEVLKKELILCSEKSESVKNYLKEIKNNVSVAVHIRRKERNDLVPIEFYLESIKLLKSKIDRPKFFIFSDDIEWCYKNLIDNDNLVFINNTKNHIEDFWLMNNCKHFIISNSTFSWWSSYLSDSEDKIILVPDSDYWPNKDILYQV